MQLIDKALGLVGLERRNTNPNDPWANFHALRNGPVNAKTAQGVSTVLACVAAISESVATLPLHLYRRQDGDTVKATDHPLYKVLHDAPNPEQTALEFREQMTAQVLTTGNAYARIVRGYDGQVRELWPLSDVSVLRLQSGKLAYEYTDQSGVVHRLLAEECLHLRHRLDAGGVLGLSPIAIARGVVELAQAELEHGVQVFRNGTRPTGVLEYPQKLKSDQIAKLRESWSSQYAGSANAGRTVVLEEGVTFKPVSLSLEDAQWIEARRFTVEEICRLFRVSPVLVGASESVTYSNAVEMNRQFVTMTLARWLKMWESAISQKLLTEAGRRTYYAEHSVEGFLRGAPTDRAAFYASGIQAGWLLKSEVRELEGRTKIDGIDDQPVEGTARTTPVQPYPSKQAEALP